MRLKSNRRRMALNPSPTVIRRISKLKTTMAIKHIREVLEGRKAQKKFITQEFQHFGYRLAEGLDDLEHKSLYIKLAKEVDRELLQRAWDFVKDSRAKSKGRLFMWKLKKLRESVVEPPVFANGTP